MEKADRVDLVIRGRRQIGKRLVNVCECFHAEKLLVVLRPHIPASLDERAY